MAAEHTPRGMCSGYRPDYPNLRTKTPRTGVRGRGRGRPYTFHIQRNGLAHPSPSTCSIRFLVFGTPFSRMLTDLHTFVSQALSNAENPSKDCTRKYSPQVWIEIFIKITPWLWNLSRGHVYRTDLRRDTANGQLVDWDWEALAASGDRKFSSRATGWRMLHLF